MADTDDPLLHLNDGERRCVSTYLSLIEQQLGTNLFEVWLFGSAARGDMWGPQMPMHSDIDLLILTSDEVPADVQGELLDATYPAFLECGRQISPAFKVAALFHLTTEERTQAFRQRVQAEGRRLHP